MCGAVLSEFFTANEISYNDRVYKKDEKSTKINDKQYREYSIYEFEPTETAPYKLWQPISKLCPLTCPDGQGFIRLFSYFPIISLVAGFHEIAHAFEVLKTRVLLNENKVYFNAVDLQDDDRLILLKRSGSRNAPLGLFQRMMITAACIVNIVRGLLAICQIGFLFIPIDIIASEMSPPYGNILERL